MKRALMAVSCLVASAAFPARAQDKVFVGHLVDYTGPTAIGGKYYGPSVRDAVDFINANGGVNGTRSTLRPSITPTRSPTPSPTTSVGRARAW